MDFNFDFDFSSLSFADKEQAQEIPKISTVPVAFENAEELAKAIDYQKDYFCLLGGSFVYGDFIEALCYHKRLCPSAIYLTTLGMSQDNIDSIVNLVDFLGCKQINLIVSHYFAGVERHKLIPYMRQEFSGRPINVAVLQSHCKICMIYSRQGNVIITGSANLSSSNNVEQFIMMHDAGMMEYTKKRLDEIMRRFTIYRGADNAFTPRNNRRIQESMPMKS